MDFNYDYGRDFERVMNLAGRGVITNTSSSNFTYVRDPDDPEPGLGGASVPRRPKPGRGGPGALKELVLA